METERLLLRPWRESDAFALYKYAQNPNIGPVAGWLPHANEEDSLRIIQTVLSGENIYAVVLKETQEPIGSIGLMPPNYELKGIDTMGLEMEVGYWIGEPFWGQGLIPEAVQRLLRYAFEELHCNLLWCSYFDGNEQSKRVAEKSGFTYHHTEYNHLVPLLGERRTLHFMRLSYTQWREIR